MREFRLIHHYSPRKFMKCEVKIDLMELGEYLLSKKAWIEKIVDIQKQLFALNDESYEKVEEMILSTNFPSSNETTINFFDLTVIASNNRPKYNHLYRKLLSHFEDSLNKYRIDKKSLFTTFHNDPNFLVTYTDNDELFNIIQNDKIDEFQTKLAKSDISINSRIKNGGKEMCLINWASFFASVKIFKFLILSKAEIDEETLDSAVFGGNSEIIHILESKKFVLGVQQLIIAIQAHRQDIIEYILNSDIHSGKESGNNSVTTYDNHSNLITNTALSKTIEFYNLEFFVHNLKYVKSPTLLFDSVRCHHIDMMDILLHIPTLDINFLNGKYSVLHTAIRMNNLVYVKYLLNCDRIDVNLKVDSRNDYTALHLAVLHRNPDIIKLLLARKDIDINAITFYSKETPLHFACRNNSFEIINILTDDERCEKKMEKRCRFFEAKTPLDISINHRKYSIAHEMKSKGFKMSRFFWYSFIFNICLFAFSVGHLMSTAVKISDFNLYLTIVEIGAVMRFILASANDMIFDDNF
ncbi:hypothetical protein TRFO_27517 [Tritrichomonas foetus]|uniref:Uncharacterized protein n=1 Tax=Tritrichomonas foetus TaxID=1144522 RepID=A0A1J4K1R6_9EUKA|nr:hypothetical protein TRFO_27513 [Tritrichomonas foetus]OHT04900.1 hypothetical protein TRFO_27517 [Tritrichomonas foetus]|eukprot:OHT04898.1 hypothetical protein TRFO_27513 [Tritrichomonas foetus]